MEINKCKGPEVEMCLSWSGISRRPGWLKYNTWQCEREWDQQAAWHFFFFLIISEWNRMSGSWRSFNISIHSLSLCNKWPRTHYSVFWFLLYLGELSIISVPTCQESRHTLMHPLLRSSAHKAVIVCHCGGFNWGWICFRAHVDGCRIPLPCSCRNEGSDFLLTMV